MNTSSNKTISFTAICLFLIIMVSVLFLVVVTTMQETEGQHWPIPIDVNQFNRVNCTFGELHTGLHFHGAIDIDHQAPNGDKPPIQTILHGRFGRNDGQGDGQYRVIYHESVPGSGIYDRASVYRHIDPSPNFVPNAPIPIGQQIGTTRAGQGHLHLMMWQLINGDWYAINPLKNEHGWSVVELRDSQQQLIGVWGNAPIDETDPQVNQVFLKGIPQSVNNVASGYQIVTSLGGIAHLYDGNNDPHAVRIHFHNRAGATTSNTPSYQSEQEQLAVFGNIATTAHCRDQNINGGAHGEGLTCPSYGLFGRQSVKI